MLAVYLPAGLPALSILLLDFGNPSAQNLARAFSVSRSTAHRWLAQDTAPRAVLMALYLAAPSYGGAVAYNRVLHAQEGQRIAMCLADSLKRSLEALEKEFGRVLAVGDFGSANEPALATYQRPSAEVLSFPTRTRA